MKLNDDFVIHDSNGMIVMVPTGKSDFSGILYLNKTAHYIVNCLKTETTIEAVVDSVYDKYNAERELIVTHVNNIIEKLRSIGAIDE